MRNASAPSIIRAQKSKSSALACPTRRGNIHAMPYSAISPRRANAVPKRAASEANRKSQYKAITSPKPTAGPLIGRNDRLAQRREVRIFLLKIHARAFARASRSLHRLGALRCVESLRCHRAQKRHVRTRAESASSSGQNDHANVFVALRRCHRGAHFLFHHGGPGIQLIRPVKRNRRDPVGYVILRFLVWHDEPDYIQ